MGDPVSEANGAHRWAVVTASTRGAAHEHTGRPNQDATGWRSLDDGLLVVAVADGHGHFRHFRAERGSQLAIQAALSCGEALTRRLGAASSTAELEPFGRDRLVPALVDEWRRLVSADLEEHPFEEDEERIAAAGPDPPVIAYGSTLLVALASDRFVLVAQIGDGDVVSVWRDGRVTTPVPGDPSLDGRYTTSLCQPGAASSFRIAAIDAEGGAVRAVLLATDGFGNAQSADPWPPAVGEDLAGMLDEHGTRWVADRLPTWTARCASAEGSGDDTTVALLVAAR